MKKRGVLTTLFIAATSILPTACIAYAIGEYQLEKGKQPTGGFTARDFAHEIDLTTMWLDKKIEAYRQKRRANKILKNLKKMNRKLQNLNFKFKEKGE